MCDPLQASRWVFTPRYAPLNEVLSVVRPLVAAAALPRHDRAGVLEVCVCGFVGWGRAGAAVIALLTK